jgi:hypothetical protein
MLAEEVVQKRTYAILGIAALRRRLLNALRDGFH